MVISTLKVGDKVVLKRTEFRSTSSGFVETEFIGVVESVSGKSVFIEYGFNITDKGKIGHWAEFSQDHSTSIITSNCFIQLISLYTPKTEMEPYSLCDWKVIRDAVS